MVTPSTTERWSPTTWPVGFRWRLLAAAAVLVATLAAVFALSGDDDATEVAVVATTQRWIEGHPPGEHAIVGVPADLAPLFALPSDLADTVVAVDVPAGTLVSPKMLRPQQPESSDRRTTLMRIGVHHEIWPSPGPLPGAQAVFSRTPGGCAAALVALVAAETAEDSATVTIEASPELAAALAEGQWWIWESPPAGWPLCHHRADRNADPTSCSAGQEECRSERAD